jgi:hypothetical protein
MHAMASQATMAGMETPVPGGTVTPAGRTTITTRDIGEDHHTDRITGHTLGRGMGQVISRGLDLITSRGRYMPILPRRYYTHRHQPQSSQIKHTLTLNHHRHLLGQPHSHSHLLQPSFSQSTLISTNPTSGPMLKKP